MKKNGFLGGAFVSTFGIILCKIVGLLYVIPFYSIIGESGGALYSYAYTIYALFLTLSSQGIPVAMSKIIIEYNTLNYQWSKERAYKMVRNLMVGLGLLWFIVLMIFAKPIAYLIIGEIEGGNTIEEVAFVIRSISCALLVVPFYATLKGYLNGHKYMTQCAISEVIEQLVRVAFIIIGSYICAKVFNLEKAMVVGVAVFGATIGSLVSYIYLRVKKSKNKELFHLESEKIPEEKNNNDKVILKRIVLVALPFVLINFVKSIYTIVDTFTINSALTSLGYTLSNSEYVLSVITTWGSKLNMIIIAFEAGLAVSLVPNISSSLVKGDMTDVNNKFNQSLQMITFICLPMVLGLSLLSTPVWNLFYGNNALGIEIFSVFVFQAIAYCFYAISIDSAQVISTLFVSFGLKALLNIPFMRLCSLLGIKAQYGPIILNLVIYMGTAFVISYVHHKKYNLSYRQSLNPILKTILISLIMLVSLKIMALFIPVNVETTKFNYLLITALYTIVGAAIYLTLALKNNLITHIFKVDVKEKIMQKLRKLKKSTN